MEDIQDSKNLAYHLCKHIDCPAHSNEYIQFHRKRNNIDRDFKRYLLMIKEDVLICQMHRQLHLDYIDRCFDESRSYWDRFRTTRTV